MHTYPNNILQVGPLLKLYQGEIDQLTRRSRFAENSFLTLYKSLYEAPDPSAALAVAVEDRPRIDALVFENGKLMKEVRTLSKCTLSYVLPAF